MNEEFKRLKRWVEECPVEAAMRIEELERKLSLLGKEWSKVVDERNLVNEKAVRYEKALFNTYVDGMTMEEILKESDKWGKAK